MTKVSEIPFASRVTAPLDVCSAGVGLSRSSLYKLITAKKVKVVKYGTRTLIVVSTLLDALGLNEDPQEASQ